MWCCKDCGAPQSSRYKLLQHCKLCHGHYGRNPRYLCTYASCPCSFRTWNSLKNHVYRAHSLPSQTATKLVTYSCQLCDFAELSSEKDYFIHIGGHLKNGQTCRCVFVGCTFETNIYSTFYSHKHRKHSPHCLKDFKPGVVTVHKGSEASEESVESDSADVLETPYAHADEDAPSDNEYNIVSVESLSAIIKKKLGCLLLKLEVLLHVPALAVDELVEALHFLLTFATVPLAQATISDVLKKHNQSVNDTVIKALAVAVCESNPVGQCFGKDGLLATAFRRRKFYKETFAVVEPVEYILDARGRRTFQYIPVLQSLQQILSKEHIFDQVVDNKVDQEISVTSCRSYGHHFKSFKDGLFYTQDGFWSQEELRISLTLYIDDFEVCNPLGTSRKKHKLCGVYWILSNLPPGSNSALSSIYLAILCKSDDIKKFGFEKVLEPLLHDLRVLEEQGVFVSVVGEFVKGAVQCVVADNLAAHGLGGFVESFSGDFICRFCTAKRTEIQTFSVSSGAFRLRTEELHAEHVRTARETSTHCFGVKRACLLTEHLSHFHVAKGYPPDIVHDVFEGVVPTELACCLSVLISKKYFSLDFLNQLILNFPYKWSDKTNKPHVVPRTVLTKKTIGGNAHENWNFLRLLPCIIGALVPEDEPAWSIILNLKDIVELVVAPVHSDESIAFLEFKICEHRDRYQELFPSTHLLPKHHFLEHYPYLIQCFGPLVCMWTMRFEAKHSFFKQLARHTNCFKNIALTLATKHQLMIAFHLHSSSLKRTSFEVKNVSLLPVEVLNKEIAHSIIQRYPNVSEVSLAKSVTVNGISYKKGMILAHGSLAGLPEFVEILQMCIFHNKLSFICKKLCCWYREHFGAYEVNASHVSELVFIEHGELLDDYPLVCYLVGAVKMLTLKRYINIDHN